MRDAGVGRVLVASLHQAIADLLPTRLGFYEHWLHVDGLREGTIGLAPLQAVLSFLREEGAPYAAIMVLAGTYAGEWSVAGLSSAERALIGALPAPLRRRWVLRVARRVVRAAYRENKATAHVRRGRARVEIHASVFCGVRHPVTSPLCLYYAALSADVLTRFGLPAHASVVQCRGMGAPSCVIDVDFDRGAEAPPASREAA